MPSVKSAQIQSNGERYIPHRYGRMISDGTPVSVGFLPDVVEENVQSGSGRYPPPRKVQTERRNERNERR